VQVDLEEVAKNIGPVIGGIPWCLIEADSQFNYEQLLVGQIISRAQIFMLLPVDDIK